MIRGDFLRLGAPVQPDVPQVLHEISTEQTYPNRLDLSDWLFDRENPLTARVTVNRYWQTFFGRGLVKSTEDFGSQGERPTHPQLLLRLPFPCVSLVFHVVASVGLRQWCESNS